MIEKKQGCIGHKVVVLAVAVGHFAAASRLDKHELRGLMQGS